MEYLLKNFIDSSAGSQSWVGGNYYTFMRQHMHKVSSIHHTKFFQIFVSWIQWFIRWIEGKINFLKCL